jgi:hypothetical protein
VCLRFALKKTVIMIIGLSLNTWVPELEQRTATTKIFYLRVKLRVLVLGAKTKYFKQSYMKKKKKKKKKKNRTYVPLSYYVGDLNSSSCDMLNSTFHTPDQMPVGGLFLIAIRTTCILSTPT